MICLNELTYMNNSFLSLHKHCIYREHIFVKWFAGAADGGDSTYCS